MAVAWFILAAVVVGLSFGSKAFVRVAVGIAALRGQEIEDEDLVTGPWVKTASRTRIKKRSS